jgi:hypothetical protein
MTPPPDDARPADNPSTATHTNKTNNRPLHRDPITDKSRPVSKLDRHGQNEVIERHLDTFG